jgi:hypothetical protein
MWLYIAFGILILCLLIISSQLEKIIDRLDRISKSGEDSAFEISNMDNSVDISRLEKVIDRLDTNLIGIKTELEILNLEVIKQSVDRLRDDLQRINQTDPSRRFP